MIRITIELFPFGKEEGKQTLATADIWNTGTNGPFLGEYGYILYDKGNRAMCKGFLGEFFRKQYTVWWLVTAVLKHAFPDVEKAFRDKEIRHSPKAIE